MELVTPGLEHLASYVAALERGWCWDNLRAESAQEELALVHRDAASFLASMTDREAKGEPIALPDGSLVPRLPGLRKWMWDGEFCGSIGLRWQHGTAALPPYCLGHIGYAVVPWKQRRGHARQALALMLREARHEGLPFVTITTAEDNRVSQRVIEANGGALVERFASPPGFGDAMRMRYRIALP
jgi:predicted acetyltransferase